MNNISSEEQDFDLWLLLARTRDIILKARQKELRQYNISTRRTAVLFAIQAIGDKATPAEISRWLFREPNSVSEILNRMEVEGLVRKVKDLDRKNMIRVVMTEKGWETYYKSTNRESIRQIMSSLSEEERQQLRLFLVRLIDGTEELIGDGAKRSVSNP